MTEEINNSLMRKLRALKAKADDKGVTEAEAATYAAKVAELLAAHGLEEAQLKVEDQEQVSHEDYVSNWNSSPAKRTLILAICKLYFIRALVRSKKGQPWTLVGKKHNIIMVKEMAAYLVKTSERLSLAYGRNYPGVNIYDFRRGCYARLSERLLILHIELAGKTQPVYNPQGNPGNLPALYRNEEQLNKIYMNARWTTVPLKKQRIKQGADAAAGRAAGDSISLNRQISGGRSNHLLERK